MLRVSKSYHTNWDVLESYIDFHHLSTNWWSPLIIARLRSSMDMKHTTICTHDLTYKMQLDKTRIKTRMIPGGNFIAAITMSVSPRKTPHLPKSSGMAQDKILPKFNQFTRCKSLEHLETIVENNDIIQHMQQISNIIKPFNISLGRIEVRSLLRWIFSCCSLDEAKVQSLIIWLVEIYRSHLAIPKKNIDDRLESCGWRTSRFVEQILL